MTSKATFAAGCFWGVESAFRALPGVAGARVGYTGGITANPTYEQVCTGTTAHAEAVEVDFDPAAISYEELLDAFFGMHNPTTLNRQGPDFGTQYRSAIFAHDEDQQKAAQSSKDRWQARFSKPIVTEIRSTSEFWPAEEYHQRYFEKRGIDPTCHI